MVLETVGTVRDYAEPVRDHLELGELHRAIDTERGAKVSGARFYFLTGVGAQLELALVNAAMAQATAAGLVPMIAPALVKPEAMEGTGFLGAHAPEVYRVEADDLYLVGTSEVPLAAYHSDEILDLSAGPLRYAGFSACFRREAGSYGKDTRGIVRVHWFDKVEMFVFCRPEDAVAEHRRLLDWERQFLTSLELPFQVVDIAAGDLGSSAARKYDCEAWFPSQGRYRELTSASNCATFQARRLNVRYRDATGKPQVCELRLAHEGRDAFWIRLQASAPAGGILIGQATFDAVSGEVAAEPFGELDLKGKLVPVPTYEVRVDRTAPA